MDQNYMHGALALYGDLFVIEIKKALSQAYDYAPGFSGSRSVIGSANKIAGVHYGYPTSLYDSVRSSYNPNTMEVEILMNEYWQWVDQGRQEGSYVPIRPLELWAQKRLGLDGAEAKSAAFGISRNIFKFGVAPTDFYNIAQQKMAEILETQLTEELGVSFAQFMQQVVEDIIPFDEELTIGL